VLERQTGFDPATSSLGSWHSPLNYGRLHAPLLFTLPWLQPRYLIVISVALIRSSLRAFQEMRLLAP
jgi:hypothetical protein